jgi:TPR repeat protein
MRRPNWGNAVRVVRTPEEKEEYAARFARASEYWDRGELRKAFEIFLGAAKEGDPSCQMNVAVFYSDGLGVKRNDARALYWYRRAYAHGGADAAVAAHNIGILYRDRGNVERALFWLERALGLGNESSGLEIAKIHLGRNKDVKKGVKYLQRLAASRTVSEGIEEEARELLKTYRSAGNGTAHIH